jgi:uridylate kinase
MRRTAKPWIIISLGGSLIAPQDIDVEYLKKFRGLLQRFENNRFLIMCGGGATCRHYIQAARQAGAKPTDHDLDFIGIRALNLNAELVRTVFGKQAFSEVLFEPSQYSTKIAKKFLISGAIKPGSSSDLNAVRWAIRLGADQVINLTNVDYVYSANPKRDPRAKPVKRLVWTDYQKIIGRKWSPGLNTPFDPIASELAKRHGLTVNIINGKKILEVKKAIMGRLFAGTVIAS